MPTCMRRSVKLPCRCTFAPFALCHADWCQPPPPPPLYSQCRLDFWFRTLCDVFLLSCGLFRSRGQIVQPEEERPSNQRLFSSRPFLYLFLPSEYGQSTSSATKPNVDGEEAPLPAPPPPRNSLGPVSSTFPLHHRGSGGATTSSSHRVLNAPNSVRVRGKVTPLLGEVVETIRFAPTVAMRCQALDTLFWLTGCPHSSSHSLEGRLDGVTNGSWILTQLSKRLLPSLWEMLDTPFSRQVCTQVGCLFVSCLDLCPDADDGIAQFLDETAMRGEESQLISATRCFSLLENCPTMPKKESIFGKCFQFMCSCLHSEFVCAALSSEILSHPFFPWTSRRSSPCGNACSRLCVFFFI